MRKVELAMSEDFKHTTIKKLVESNGIKKAVAQQLHCTTRTINRLIIKYNTEGKSGFLHGNRGRRPITCSIKK